MSKKKPKWFVVGNKIINLKDVGYFETGKDCIYVYMQNGDELSCKVYDPVDVGAEFSRLAKKLGIESK